ncbi:hypothetical protein [Falsiruegeria mediterranea]
MPFDMTPEPERPEIDRDAAALAVQAELGRPLTWSEYCKVWNACTRAMDPDGTRTDYLLGPCDPV